MVDLIELTVRFGLKNEKKNKNLAKKEIIYIFVD